MAILKKKLPAKPNPSGSVATKPAPKKVSPNESKTQAPTKPREGGESQEAPKPTVPREQPADSREPRPATSRAPKQAKEFVMEEGRQFRHNKTKYVWTLRKHKHKKGHWYFTRENEEGERWAIHEAPEEEVLEALKEECTPL